MKNQGFTLLEVIIALGLLSLILALTISFTPDTDHKQLLEQYVHQFANDIRYTKEYARTNNTGFLFVVDTGNNSYRVIRGNFELLRVQLPKDYTVRCNLMRNEFYVSNLGKINENFTITLIDKEGNIGRIILSMGTGRVRVEINE